MLAMLPLETLPGWPEAPDPGLAEMLAICLGIPLAITVPLLLFILGPTWLRQTRATSLESASSQVAPADKTSGR